MTAKTHGRSGRPWRRIRAQVLLEEPSCRYCGAPSTTVDHKVPLAVAPQLAHVRSNLVGCCKTCNGRKGAAVVKPAAVVCPAHGVPCCGVHSRDW